MYILYNTSATKVIIILYMTKQAPDAFVHWLLGQMDKKKWSIREAARKANISHTLVSNAVNGDLPSYETCIALAKAFNQPQHLVLNLAGLLDMPPDWSPTQAEWDDLFARLSPEDQAEMLEIVRIKLNKTKSHPLPNNHPLKRPSGA